MFVISNIQHVMTIPDLSPYQMPHAELQWLFITVIPKYSTQPPCCILHKVFQILFESFIHYII